MSDIVQVAADTLAGELCQHLSLGGWDQPAKLYSITMPDSDQAHDADPAKPSISMTWLAATETIIGGDVFNELATLELPDQPERIGLVLATEAWMVDTTGDAGWRRGTRIDQLPDRIETRIVIVVLTDGTTVTHCHPRDQEPQPEGTYESRLTAAMRRHLGLSSDISWQLPARDAARAALVTSLLMVVDPELIPAGTASAVIDAALTDPVRILNQLPIAGGGLHVAYDDPAAGWEDVLREARATTQQDSALRRFIALTDSDLLAHSIEQSLPATSELLGAITKREQAGALEPAAATALRRVLR